MREYPSDRIDLRSDTVTQPTAAMRDAMRDAMRENKSTNCAQEEHGE